MSLADPVCAGPCAGRSGPWVLRHRMRPGPGTDENCHLHRVRAGHHHGGCAGQSRGRRRALPGQHCAVGGSCLVHGARACHVSWPGRTACDLARTRVAARVDEAQARVGCVARCHGRRLPQCLSAGLNRQHKDTNAKTQDTNMKRFAVVASNRRAFRPAGARQISRSPSTTPTRAWRPPWRNRARPSWASRMAGHRG